jgi:hypothetical protein
MAKTLDGKEKLIYTLSPREIRGFLQGENLSSTILCKVNKAAHQVKNHCPLLGAFFMGIKR